MANITRFNGGIVKSLDPTLLQPQAAQRLVNTDPEKGILQSAKGYTDVGIELQRSFYNFEGTWLSGDDRDYTEFENNLYFTDSGIDTQKFSQDRVYSLIGIRKPPNIPAVNADGAELVDDEDIQFNGLVLSTNISSAPDYPASLGSTFVVRPIVYRNFIEIPYVSFPNATYAYRAVFTYGSGKVNTTNFTLVTGVNHVFDTYIQLIFTPGTNTTLFSSISVYRNYLGAYKFVGSIDGTGSTTINGGIYGIPATETVVYPNGIYDANINAYTGSFQLFDNIYDISANATYVAQSDATGVAPVTRQWTATFYNSTSGIESPQMLISNEHTSNLPVEISKIPVSEDPQVTHVRIYRLGGTLTSTTRVAQIENGIDTFVDSIIETDATEILTSQDHYAPPVGLHSIVEHDGRLFGLSNNELLFSELGEANVWPPEYSLQLRRNATGLISMTQGLLVFTDLETYLLVTSSKVSSFNLILLTPRQGCLTHKSCQVLKSQPMWVSHEGICTWSSGYVNVISKPIYGFLSLEIEQSVVWNEQYFLLKKDGTILVLDHRTTLKFYELEFSEKIEGIGTFNGKLYFIVGGMLKEAFTGELLKLKYTSPVFIDGGHSTQKQYNNIYMRSDGEFNIKVFIDGTEVVNKDVSGNTTHDITPPAAEQRGYNQHYEVEGTGTVYAIETKPFGRQNAR